MINYVQKIQNLNDPSFEKIKTIATSHCGCDCIGRNICKPWKTLDHGLKILTTHEELCKYLCAYGDMHEAKIKDAVRHLPLEILSCDFEIVDWGCGQGLGTICLLDYLKSKNLENNVKRVTLVEPSIIALDRAKLHVSAYIKEKKINVFSKFFHNIQRKDFLSNKLLPIIHIFSNILDLKEVDLKELALKIDSAVEDDTYIVAVGPLNSTNKRIDAFYNYFNAPIVYNYENRQFDYGGFSTCTYKAKIFKLEFNELGNLIPIEFYPAVQFQSSYQLDCVDNSYDKNFLNTNFKNLSVFDLSAPFDIGASVYDDIHPILAVLNNIVTRGLPTKASPFIENNFQKAFNYSKIDIRNESLSYKIVNNEKFDELINWYDLILTNKKELKFSEINIEKLQLMFSPIAIARIQKVVLEALMTDKLDIKKEQWNILVEENDVPCSALAFADLSQMFHNIALLSRDYQDFVFPEVNLEIISSEYFANSSLHLNNKVFSKAKSFHFKNEYDLVIDIATFKTYEIEKESFSKFKSINKCYFNIRSATISRSERSIYTTDKIYYRELVAENVRGIYSNNEVVIEYLKYFLKLIFRKNDFRPGQLPILNRALQNKCVIGLLPTGGGKSLTYQLASMLQPGVTVVVDPLRSLMKDQYDGLINVGIDACAFINSTQYKEQMNTAERKMEESRLIFIFLSPERLAIYKFRQKLKNMHELNVYFSYGVIDEVHCVSEWGHDFRLSYLHLGRNLYKYVRAKHGHISLFGLTATASFDVLADVERELSGNGAFPLDSETIIRYENSNRLELQYKIEKVSVNFEEDINFDKNKYIDSSLPKPVKVSNKWGFFNSKLEFIKNYISLVPKYIREIQSSEALKSIIDNFSKRQGDDFLFHNELEVDIPDNYYLKNKIYNESGIIFCPHKKNTEISVNSVLTALKSFVPDIGAFYGGDDGSNSSMSNIDLFRNNKIPLMVATKAFGMGIDKPNVRFTINLNYSSSLEGFVQEAGRAGRDRKIALSVILLSDYKLARINRKCTKNTFPISMLKGRWFKPNDLQKIINFYNLDVEDSFIDYLTPENDLVRLFCREGKKSKYFNFNSCNDDSCRLFNKCQLRHLPKEAEGWMYKDDLFEILINKNLKIDSKFIEYQNADYETVIYFYNNSFKGEFIEKQSMHQILNLLDVDMFFGDDLEVKINDLVRVKGFLSTLINVKEDTEIVSYIHYKNKNCSILGIDEVDIAKAIYRMTCIGLLEDFTQDYKNNRYRIVSKRKIEGSYYKCLEQFLLRYYSADRASEEINKVYDIKVISNYELDKEIYQCLSYLTTFVYDKISVKRKRAIDDMRTFCIIGANETKDWQDNNEELKDFIYYYFNSKYAKADYIADNGEDYSLTNDTDGGKESRDLILFKYLKIIDSTIEQSTPIDNVKHLHGAVRLLRRSLTDTNPTLSLLNSFCLFFLGINNNENLKNEVIENYIDGMLGFAERSQLLHDFWEIFYKYNQIIEPYSNGLLATLKEDVVFRVNAAELKKITSKYVGSNAYSQ